MELVGKKIKIDKTFFETIIIYVFIIFEPTINIFLIISINNFFKNILIWISGITLNIY